MWWRLGDSADDGQMEDNGCENSGRSDCLDENVMLALEFSVYGNERFSKLCSVKLDNTFFGSSLLVSMQVDSGQILSIENECCRPRRIPWQEGVMRNGLRKEKESDAIKPIELIGAYS